MRVVRWTERLATATCLALLAGTFAVCSPAPSQLETLWVVIPTGQQASGMWIDDIIKERVLERGMAGRYPLVGQFPRQRVEVIRAQNAAAEVNRLFYERGWTDGLPVVPPTLGKVREMLRYTDRLPGEVVAELDPLRGQATVERIAANAVMAGCRPEYLPILIAAVEALADPEFNLRGVQTTDENVAPLLIISGPIVKELAINTSFGVLGPGWQANASIGRAIRLILNNIGGGWPGPVSMAGLGQPARYALCIAENTEESPWEPVGVELGYRPEANLVILMRAESVVNVTGGLTELASVMGSLTSVFTIMHSGRVAVILAPFVAQQLAAKGWTKADVRQHLYEHGRLPVAQWSDSWARTLKIRWPDWVEAAVPAGAIPAVRAPDDITVLVAGPNVAIPQSAYFPSWGFPPCRVVREVRWPGE